ncbi:MAG: ATPase domain-containing protein [Thermoplasmata archaeon]|nr:ATPase domain-containing protein [Thermoplasmata archaeon]
MGDELVKTYIDGFDDKMQGGIPAGSVVLLVGQPGTMKSSVAYNILFNNARENGTKGLYVTLEQGAKSLSNHMTKMGMSPKDVVDRLEIVDIGLIRKKLTALADQSWVQVFKMYTKNLKETNDYQLLVIDSLPVLNVLAKFDNPREELFHLFEWLRDLNVTTFLITEMTPDTPKFALHGEDFLADGIIYLRMAEIGDISVQRQIRCVKMRSANHNGDYHSLLFDGGRFKATRSIAQSR